MRSLPRCEINPQLCDIGTDATIAQHIQNIVDREYAIERMEGSMKYLVPSTLGVALVEGYDKIGLDKSVSKPQLRREVSSCPSDLFFSPEHFRRSEGWSKSASEVSRNRLCSISHCSSTKKCLGLWKTIGISWSRLSSFVFYCASVLIKMPECGTILRW